MDDIHHELGPNGGTWAMYQPFVIEEAFVESVINPARWGCYSKVKGHQTCARRI